MASSPHDSQAAEQELQPAAILHVCLCHNLRRATRILTRAYDQALAPAGLTASQFAILAAIAARQPVMAPTLAAILALDRTTLHRNLKPLRRMGYITGDGGLGRRAGQVSLTMEGRFALREAGPLWRGAQASLSQRLGSARTGQLLTALAAAMEAVAEE